MMISRRNSQAGNIFLVLFGAIAVLGLLGVGVTNFMKGSMSSAVKLTRNNTALTQMAIAAQSAVMAAANLGASGDCDGDSFVEPLEWRIDATKPKPTNGNLLPSNIGAPTVDPWGTDYGYCVWDHGASILGAACQQNTPSTNARLQGYGGRAQPVVAIISAGPDKVFTTTCRNFTAGSDRADQNSNGVLGDVGDYELVAKDNATSDDLIFSYTYEEASSAAGGLWILKSTDANTATIDKAIEANQAKFTGTSLLTSLGAMQGTAKDCTGLGARYYNDPLTGHCYFQTAASGSWATSKATCEANGAYLANITSKTENDLIMANMSVTGTRWLGGTDSAVEGVWRYSGGMEAGMQFWAGDSSGSAVNGNYTRWSGSGEPSTSSASNDYLTIFSNGNWYVPSSTNWPGICEKEPMQAADCTGLGAGFYNDAASGHCYYRSGSNANWDNAKLACQANNGYLATISSAAENTLISANLTLAGNSWIGATDAATEGDWRWSGGELIGQQFWSGDTTGAAVGGLYSNWSSGLSAPTADASKNCVSIDNPGYKWHDGGCPSAIAYVCEKSPLPLDIEITSGLKLADAAAMPTCNATNAGVLRRSTSSSMQICDGSSWITQGTATAIDDLTDGIADYTKNNLFAGLGAGNTTLTGTDNVGIVTGPAMASLTTGTGNTAMGYYAMRTLTSCSYNVSVGSKSMQTTTDANYTTAVGYFSCANIGAGAVNNTCIGHTSLTSNNSSDITALGQTALRFNNGTTYNTGVGANALGATTTGPANTGVGYNALGLNVTGMNNTAIGYNAGARILTSSNTAVGFNAMYNSKYPGGQTVFGTNALYSQVSNTSSDSADGITAIGANALYSQNYIGSTSNSTAFGYQAIYSNTSSILDTAIGSNALYGNLSSNSNTAVGKSALIGKTGGSSNVAIGSNAIVATGNNSSNTAIGSYAATSTTASYLTAIGYRSLYSNTTGIGNVAVGYLTLEANTTGNYNTAIGYQALLVNSGANKNTAIGYAALKSVISADSNTAVGTEVLTSATGGGNTAVGYRSMFSSVGANNNTAIGSNTLYANITGFNNVAIGKNALQAADQSENVAIGNSAMASATTAQGTAFGSEALYTNTTSNNSTAFGAGALYSMNTGSSPNSAAGYNAGYSASGSGPVDMVALGAMAANLNTSVSTVAVGAYAFKNNGTGGYNAAFGAGAGNYNSQASSTIAFGYRAMGLGVGPISGSVGIGAYALAKNISNTDTNIAIGYRANFDRLTSTGGTSIGSLATSSNYINSTAIGYNTVTFAGNAIRLGDTNITAIEGQVAFTNPSDKRLKKDIQPSDLGLDFIMGLKPVSYRLKQGNGRLDYGFLAQDIEASLDGRITNMIIRLDDKIRTYQWRSNDMIAPLVKAIQERQVKIEDLKRQIKDLKQDTAPSCREGSR